MKCKKCEKEIEEADAMVLKRGRFENKFLCPTCFAEEKEILLSGEE